MTVVADNARNSDIDNKLNLANSVFKDILPSNRDWIVSYSKYTSQFSCLTKLQMDGAKGLVGIVVKVEINKNLNLVVTRIAGSRKNSPSTWNGERYGYYRDCALRVFGRKWLKHFEDIGVEVYEDALIIENDNAEEVE